MLADRRSAGVPKSRNHIVITARRSALPASVCDRKRSFSGFTVIAAVVWGWLSLLPVPDSCRILRAGGPGSRGAQRPRSGTGGVPLTRLSGSRIIAAGRGQGAWRVRNSVARFVSGGPPWAEGGLRAALAAEWQARGSQPYLGPRDTGSGPGDMMTDWVPPACGGAAAQSDQAVRLVRAGRRRLTAVRRELAAVVPIG